MSISKQSAMATIRQQFKSRIPKSARTIATSNNSNGVGVFPVP